MDSLKVMADTLNSDVVFHSDTLLHKVQIVGDNGNNFFKMDNPLTY